MLNASPAPHPFRIAYVINSMEGGGAASPVPSIVDVMRRCGAEVQVFALTRRDGLAIPALVDAGIPVEVRAGGERDHGRALAWLLQRLRAWRPTHIWTSLTRATLLGQLVGARLSLPVVSWQHAAFLKPANRRLLRWTRRLSILWVADSEAVAALTEKRLKIAPDRLMVWPIFRAGAAAPRSTTWEPGQCLRLGSLGRLHPVKGYETLLRAVAKLRERGARFELTIAGEGAQRSALEELIGELGLGDVHLPGFAADPRAFLAGLHLYIQPSRSEGFCIAAHEAMQAGLPVIASSVGELAYSVEPGRTGDLFVPGDVDALAESIGAMIAQPEHMAVMGGLARDRVLRRFGADAFETRGRAVIERLISLSCGAGSGVPRDAPLSQGPGAKASSA